MWRLLAAPQNPRCHRDPVQPRSPPAAHPGGSLRQPARPRLSRGIKRGDKEGTRLWTLPAGQEAAAGLVPKVLGLRSLLGARREVPELRRPRCPPSVPGSFPKFPAMRKEPGSLLDTLPGLPKPRGERRARQPPPARCHIPGLPQAGIQPCGERRIPGRSSPRSRFLPAPATPRHLRDGMEGLRLLRGTPERGGRRQRGSAEATCPPGTPRPRAKRRFMRTPTRDWTAWRKPSASWK